MASVSYNTAVDAREHKRTYTVVIEPDPENGGFVATIPSVPGVVGQGETEEEALANAKSALESGSAPADFYRVPDLATLADEQGISAVEDIDGLAGDFWPEDEDPDEFVATLREWRRESP